jgi:hypothetical protein
MTTPPRTPTPLDAAWEALEAEIHGIKDDFIRDAIARHRPLIEAEATAAPRARILGHLQDRLWGCDADANAVLNIVEGES